MFDRLSIPRSTYMTEPGDLRKEGCEAYGCSRIKKNRQKSYSTNIDVVMARIESHLFDDDTHKHEPESERRERLDTLQGIWIQRNPNDEAIEK